MLGGGTSMQLSTARTPTSLLLVPLALGLLASQPSQARADEDPVRVAHQLRQGELTPAQAAAAWDDADLDPDEVLELLSDLPPLEVPAGDHQAEIEDDHGRTTDVRVLLPPDGPDRDGSYRLIVLLHGIGGDSEEAIEGARGLAPPHTIVVAPSAQNPPGDAGFEDLRRANSVGVDIASRFPHWWCYYPTAFPMQALEYALLRYPIDTNRVVLAGYSMGGFGTWNLGLRYPDRFAGIMPLCGGIAREEFAIGRDELCRTLLGNANLLPTLFVHGDQDDVVPVRFDRWSDEDLTARGITHEYIEVAGGGHILREFLDPDGELKTRCKAWLNGRVRDPHPARVEHHLIGDYHAGSYWVRVDEHRGQTAQVTAEVQDRGRGISVTTQDVARLTLFLDPEVVRVRDRITVVVDGQPVFRNRVRPSLLAVAESYARSHDPLLTYTRSITLDVTPQQVEETSSNPLDGLIPRRR
jgi:predicted esterase